MPLRLPTVTASPETVTFADGDDAPQYRVGPLSYYDLGQLQLVIDRLAVGPLEAAAPLLARLPPDERADLYRRALAAQGRWSPPDVGTPDGNDVLLSTSEARRDFLAVALRAYNPDIDPATIDGIHKALTIDGYIAVRNICLEQPRDPKDPGGSESPANSPDTSMDSDPTEQARRAESLLALLEAWRAERSRYKWLTASSSTTPG